MEYIASTSAREEMPFKAGDKVTLIGNGKTYTVKSVWGQPNGTSELRLIGRRKWYRPSAVRRAG